MCRTDTQDKLHRGGYLGVLAVLMNLRKGLYEIIKKSSTNENLVCNHPDLLEPRPVESPFLISPITFHLPRLLVSILPHNLARGYTGIVWQKLPVTGQISFMNIFFETSIQATLSMYLLAVSSAFSIFTRFNKFRQSLFLRECLKKKRTDTCIRSRVQAMSGYF